MATAVSKEVELTKFKVRQGFAVVKDADGERHVYKKGQVFVSHKPLHKMFSNKFDVVGTGGTMKLEKKKGSKKQTAPKVRVLEEIGKDVSHKFPEAIDKRLRVYQTEDGDYHITDEHDLFTPLNRKSLSRAGVRKFIEER